VFNSWSARHVVSPSASGRLPQPVRDSGIVSRTTSRPPRHCQAFDTNLPKTHLFGNHIRTLSGSRGATTFSKFGAPIPWSTLLYRTKYGWYTQFRALLRKKLGWSVQLFFFFGGGSGPPTPQWLRPCLVVSLATVDREFVS